MFFLPEPGLRPRLAGVRIRFARHWATSVCVGGQGEKKRRGRGRRKEGREKGGKEKRRMTGKYSTLQLYTHNAQTFFCPALASFHQSHVS